METVKKYIAGEGWKDVPKEVKRSVSVSPSYSRANEFPTEAQKKMNNGMTAKKIRILNEKIAQNVSDSQAGRITHTKCFNLNIIPCRDIAIYAGKETAWLNG